MQLPFQPTFQLLQTKWKSILDPFLANPINKVSVLKSVALTAGQTNQVSHKLGRKPQGFFVVDAEVGTSVFRTQVSDINFLYLDCTVTATVSLGVF